MRHNLSISVSKKPTCTGIVACRNVTVREKIMRMLFGLPCKVTIVVPGDSVDEVAIKEVADGDDESE